MEMICDHWKTCKNEGCEYRKPQDSSFFNNTLLKPPKFFNCGYYAGKCISDYGNTQPVQAILYTPDPTPEYEVIKPVSVRAIIEVQGKGCDEFWSILSSFHVEVNRPHLEEEIPQDMVISFAVNHPKVIDWLINHGFIRVKEEALKPCPFKSCGGEGKLEIGLASYWIRCKICASVGPKGKTETEARQRWNER